LVIRILEFKRQLEGHLRVYLKFKSLLEGPKNRDHYATKPKAKIAAKSKTKIATFSRLGLCC